VEGNLRLDTSVRAAEIFTPYHDGIAALLDARRHRTLIVSLHSFAPALAGQDHPWRFGVLHRSGSPFSDAVLVALERRLGEDLVGDNAPYAMDETVFTVPHHADPRGLDYLELEVRQDLLAEPMAQDEVAAFFGDILSEAFAGLSCA
jgi:predicted N-formylglutamate amidohydrolase